MTDRFSNLQGMDQSPVGEKADKGDFMLVGFILVLLACVGGFLVLNPAESKLRTAVIVEEQEIRPDTPPVALEPVPTISTIAAGVDAQSGAFEDVSAEAVTPEVAADEASALEQAAPEPVPAETDIPQAALPADSIPEMPVAAEAVEVETVTAEPATPVAKTNPAAVAPEAVVSEAVTPEPVSPESVSPEPAAPVTVATTAPATGNNSAGSRGNKDTLVWAVNLTSLSTQSSAQEVIDQLKAEGIEADQIPVHARGHTYYRVRIPDLASRQEADKAKAALMEHPDYKDSWVNSYRK